MHWKTSCGKVFLKQSNLTSSAFLTFDKKCFNTTENFCYMLEVIGNRIGSVLPQEFFKLLRCYREKLKCSVARRWALLPCRFSLLLPRLASASNFYFLPSPILKLRDHATFTSQAQPHFFLFLLCSALPVTIWCIMHLTIYIADIKGSAFYMGAHSNIESNRTLFDSLFKSFEYLHTHNRHPC